MAERPEPVARLLSELDALRGDVTPGARGRELAHRRAALVDACLVGLCELAAPPDDVALVALGGYGRGELAPYSDLDLLILHGGRDIDELRALAERLLYPLWDAGLEVGHAVRTVEECASLAEQRFDAAVAMLDARAVAGDRGLAAELSATLRGFPLRDRRRFAERLLAEARERHDRYGSAAYLLEPDLKNGSGGLRDVHTLRWLACALPEGGGDALGGLEASGLLRKGERGAVEAAEEFLTLVRSALHLAAGRRLDRLERELQSQLARRLAFTDAPDLPAVDGLMRAVFEQARQVEHVVGLVFERFLREGVPDRESVPESGAEGVLRVFADVAEERLALTPALLDQVERVEFRGGVAWSEEVRDAFLRILRAGESGIRALEAMDRLGLLERVLPEWMPVRCRPQRDPYHRYTVDVHLRETLRGMTGLLAGEGADDPVAIQAMEAVVDPDALLLGALLHDIGKNGRGGHVAEGARVAAAALERMNLPERTAELARFMVAHHLLLPDTATRRDLADDDLILDVAARVGGQERLASLYLLTVADAEATGPAAWTPWRQTLIRELVAKVQHVIERGEMGEEVAERLAARADDLRKLLAGEDPAAVERFILRMPRSYLLTVPAERAAEHFPLVAEELGEHEVHTSAGPGERASTYAVTVVAADRPGLLSWIAGAFTLAGLSILTAQVFTTSDAVAVDLFEVEGVFEPDVTEDRWEEFRTGLGLAVGGDAGALERRISDKRRHYRPPRSEIPVEVTMDNAASDFFTVIEVGAPDRIGLLHDVTRTLADLQLDVHLAKVATYGERVVDAFYVRDMLGRKVEEADRAGEIERALVARLSA